MGPLHPWRRFGSAHAGCVSGSEKGVNYTSHHLRCERIDSATSRRLRCNTSKLSISRSWPGAPSPVQDEDDSFSNVFTPQPELRYTERNTKTQPYQLADTPSSKPRTSTSFTALQIPPTCRLPTSIRFTTLLLYLSIILSLISSTAAAPFLISKPHSPLHNRQSIPDASGNTGNQPAAVKPQPDPVTITTFGSATVSPSLSLTTSITSATTTSPTSTRTPGSTNGNSNSPDSLGMGPGKTPPPPAEELQLTKPQFPLSLGALAGIISGGVVVIAIIIGLSVFLYRRHLRRPEIEEIPIRRSKLGSRLGRRIFGSPNPSRAASPSSRRSSASLTGDAREKAVEGWLDKGTISRPKAAWSENGMLSVPRPAFMREEKEKVESVDGEKWVGNEKKGSSLRGTISAPRPGRPVSAEPLGRLSGMGLGMGYMK